jgi:hypothetical protein
MEDRVVNRGLPVTGYPEGQPAGSNTMRESGLDVMPLSVRREFPWLEAATETDLRVIERQLGRPPRGEAFIACRCDIGRPAVLLSLPEHGAGRPVPPLLWLSCPYQVREVSRMESRGTISKYGEALRLKGAEDQEKRLFNDGEERFGRVQALLLEGRIGAPVEELENRGVAGGRPGVVKCLHAHLAYRLASGRGVVGGWCLEELDNGRGRICETIPEACLT